MQIILLEKIRKLGNLGDAVDVKPGFARNYLIPQGKAVFATEKNLLDFEQRRSELEKKALQSFGQAEQRAAKLNEVTIQIAALASDEGKLYGSVGATEVREALEANAIEVNKREIVMTPIYSVGEYEVDIHVHSDVVATIKVQVIASKK